MNINLFLLPTLFLTMVLFAAGLLLPARTVRGSGRLALPALALVAAVPAVLYAAYYAHVLDRAAWFYELRAIPLTELLAAGAGFSFGIAAAALARISVVSASAILRRLIPLFFFAVALLLISIPYAKSFIVPLTVQLKDRWVHNVCLQTTPSTCGPSSAATLLRFFEDRVSERQMARACLTGGTGTENWYIARALRDRGLVTEVRILPVQPSDPPYPSLAGTLYGGAGGAGHFIALLDKREGRYLLGDPIAGRLFLTPAQLRERYYLTGFFMTVQRPRPTGPSGGNRMSEPDPYHLHGETQIRTYYGPASGLTRRLRIYYPPGYDNTRAKPYPVLYLLHGSPGDESNWTQYGDVAGILDRLYGLQGCEAFLVVMPDSGAGGAAHGARTFERELTQELIPWVEQNLHARTDAAGRAIAGLSMGGFQAAAIGLRRPGRFGAVGVFSAGLREGFVTASDLGAATRDGSAAGGSPQPEAQAAALPRVVYVRAGKSDFLLGSARALHRWLERERISHVYSEAPGGHDWSLWRSALEDLAPRLFRG